MCTQEDIHACLFTGAILVDVMSQNELTTILQLFKYLRLYHKSLIQHTLHSSMPFCCLFLVSNQVTVVKWFKRQAWLRNIIFSLTAGTAILEDYISLSSLLFKQVKLSLLMKKVKNFFQLQLVNLQGRSNKAMSSQLSDILSLLCLSSFALCKRILLMCLEFANMLQNLH